MTDHDKLQSNEFAKQKAVELLARWPVEEDLSHRHWEDNRADATALLAQIAPLLSVTAEALEPTRVKVKPLEWDHGIAEGFACSRAGVLRYTIMLSVNRVYGMAGKYDGAAQFPTIEAAKAAAQADYEARILSAVEAVPVAQAVESERERCAKELEELRRQLGGGCDASGGQEHLVIKQGSYAFCGNCGESLRGVRYCHMTPEQSAAAIRKQEGVPPRRDWGFTICECGMSGPCMSEKCKHPLVSKQDGV